MQLHSGTRIDVNPGETDRTAKAAPLSAQPRPHPTAPPSSFAAQALAACVYLALQCPRCGDVRQSRHALPSTSTALCPGCGASCSFVYLGKGFTCRKLPFSEVRRGEPQLLHRRDEVP